MLLQLLPGRAVANKGQAHIVRQVQEDLLEDHQVLFCIPVAAGECIGSALLDHQLPAMPSALTSSQASDIGQNHTVRAASAHTFPHFLRPESRVEDLGVHCLLPHVYALAATFVGVQLSLRGRDSVHRSVNFCQLQGLQGHALLTFIMLEGTRVRSAMSVQKRMSFHIGSTRPLQVYCGI